MKKNIIILVSLIILTASATFFYLNINQSKKDKKINFQSNIPNITEMQIIDSINALANAASTKTNAYIPNDSLHKMELKILKPPKIYSTSNSGLESFAYNIRYGSTFNIGELQLINNTSVINDPIGDFYIDIYMIYNTAMTYRTKKIEKSNNPFKSLEELQQVVTTRFEQGITFTISNLKITDPINMPEKINIWNKQSTELYPCYLYKNEMMPATSSYLIKYSCVKLPNVNDYTGDLEILFD